MKILVTRRTIVLAIFKPERIRADWQDKVFTCDTCDCQFQLNSDDELKVLARLEEMDGGNLGLNDFLVYFVFCPENCGTTVKVGDSFPSSDDYKQVVHLKI